MLATTLMERVRAAAVVVVMVVLQQCTADILIVSTTSNQTFSAISDAPSLFGPPIPFLGFKGYAVHATPHNGCVVPARPPVTPKTGPWIAIIRRFNCTFVDKVLNAQIAGYDAVIVHNVESNSLQRMGSNQPDKEAKVRIPSVFIGEDDAWMINENFLYNKGFMLVITDDLPFNIQSYLLPFAITMGICFIVILGFMVVKCVRDYRRSCRHRLSSRSLKKLPVVKFKKGDPYECCAICLEDYVDNDKLRVLPCQHAYHSRCIDPWLTKNRRVCPVCKRKVFTGDERPSDLDTDSEDEERPLLSPQPGTQGGTFQQQEENPFQEALRQAQERQRQQEERRRRRRRRRNGSRHVECGPEGYQRLAESTEDEEDQEDQGGEEGESEEAEVAEDRGREEEEELPSVVVHGPAAPPTTPLTDSSSVGSQESQGSQGSGCPGPVQIAVDVLNSPTEEQASPPHQPRPSRDYVV